MIFINFLIGSTAGSFISCLAVRKHRQESIIFPGSHCDNCQHSLTFYELIPIISFLVLKGKCRYCSAKIYPLSFIVETLLGITLALIYLWQLPPLFIIEVLILTYLSIDDIYQLTVSIPAVCSLLIISIAQNHHPYHQLLIISIIYLGLLVINHRQAFIGNGDIDILICLWITSNSITTLWTIFLACIISLGYIISSPWPVENKIPFVPFITLGYILATYLATLTFSWWPY